MKLLVGLGNPGSSYEQNRHNAGFMAIDAIARHYTFEPWKTKFHGLLSAGTIDGHKTLLLKPHTFMNRSGQSVGECMRFYKLTPNDIIVMHDELDLPFAALKVKQAGGHAGHNGLRDCDAHIGKDYWRLRIGIDHPGDKHQVSNYVLSDFTKAEQKELPHLLDHITTRIPLFAAQGGEALQQGINA